MEIKHCASCGRPFEHQKRFEKNWEEIKYCSSKCRREKLEKKQAELEKFITHKLIGVSNICPSQIAQEFYGDSWRAEMEPIRCACRRLHQKGVLLITQNKKIVTSLNFKGPIRIQKKS